MPSCPTFCPLPLCQVFQFLKSFVTEEKCCWEHSSLVWRCLFTHPCVSKVSSLTPDSTVMVAHLILLPGFFCESLEEKCAQPEHIFTCWGSKHFIWAVSLGCGREISKSVMCHSFEGQLRVESTYIGRAPGYLTAEEMGQCDCVLHSCWDLTGVSAALRAVRAVGYRGSLPVEDHSHVLGLNIWEVIK